MVILSKVTVLGLCWVWFLEADIPKGTLTELKCLHYCTMLITNINRCLVCKNESRRMICFGLLLNSQDPWNHFRYHVPLLTS